MYVSWGALSSQVAEGPKKLGSQSTNEAQDDDGEGEQCCTIDSSKWVKGIRNAG